MTLTFTEVEQDAVTELMNMGVGRAAGAFSKLVQDEVLLSVPSVRFMAVEEANKAFSEAIPAVLAGVMQSFDGFITGTAALLFPEERSLELVRAVLGEDMPAEDISELEQETLAEIGNILLNNCLATLANVLHRDIHSSLPETYSGGRDHVLGALCPFIPPGQAEREPPSVLMLVQIDFSLKTRAIQGYLAFVIDLHSAESFRAAIRDYLSEMGIS